MRIGITCYPSAGGSGVVATELGIALAERGHTVHFVSYEMPFRLGGVYHDRIRFHRVETASYPLFKFPPFSLSLASKMAEVALDEDLDLLHVHYAIPHAACALLARDMIEAHGRSIKIVTTLHGTDITLVGTDPSFFEITQYAIAKSDAVTCVSEWLLKETRQTLHTTNEITVIPNFVDTDAFDPLRCPLLELAPGGEPIMMHISNFRPVKRVPDVLDVFARVNREIPSRLVLVGDGPEKMIVRWKIRTLGLHDRVEMLGQQDGIRDLLGCADVFLLPSEHESFGLVALEAMACEVPVVATDGGGLPEVIEDGKTGYLTEIGDCTAMADRVTKLLRDKDLCKRMGQAGRRRAIEHFSKDDIVTRYETLYDSL
ncbi:MAG: N-acetyl-alpha-D-glucosaminyl L-malate synthase BshA [Candidatus Hydrogenedentes bacterium]|nr:N-acetyl-alpha-D-glucosaminyl L-malate synthase BshA [Candidatus Hydrogenedentota bacterium]